MLNDVPATILKKHPELLQIGMALREYYQNIPITICCHICEKKLIVTEVSATNSIWVTCEIGCISYCAKRQYS